jgi:dihydrofolate reductase
MRKIISYLHASLDGFVQGKDAWDLNWISYDQDLEAYARELLSTVDTVLWGRVTFLGMQSYWPTVSENPQSSEHEKNHSAWLENTEKIAVSTTLENVTWNKSRLIKANLAEEISKLKKEEGQDIMILGSPGLTHSLTQLGLIDEYRININPITLGEGIPAFKSNVKLKLLGSRTFDSGVVGLHYQTLQEGV